MAAFARPRRATQTLTLFLQLSVRSEEPASGVAQWLACWAHNPKVRGSKPRSAMASRSLGRSDFASGGFPGSRPPASTSSSGQDVALWPRQPRFDSWRGHPLQCPTCRSAAPRHPLCRRDGNRSQDSLPEWSKGVDSSSTSASCVGSNPTGVNCLKQSKQASENKIERDGDSKTARDADGERDGDRG